MFASQALARQPSVEGLEAVDLLVDGGRLVAFLQQATPVAGDVETSQVAVEVHAHPGEVGQEAMDVADVALDSLGPFAVLGQVGGKGANDFFAHGFITPFLFLDKRKTPTDACLLAQGTSINWRQHSVTYSFAPKESRQAVDLSKTTNPKDFLDTALKRQGVEATPKGLKETWIEGDYKYEVRIHDANPEYGKTGSIYRVSRQRVNIPEGQQGTGVEYMDVNGNWQHQSTLKPGKSGNANPNYNDTAAKETHIQLE